MSNNQLTSEDIHKLLGKPGTVTATSIRGFSLEIKRQGSHEYEFAGYLENHEEARQIISDYFSSQLPKSNGGKIEAFDEQAHARMKKVFEY